MNVAFIGFGMVAERFHGPLLAAEPYFRLTHVVERHQNRARECYPKVVTVRRAEELWTLPVELVVILTPNDTHYELARQALQAGKHVVVDKPFTVTSGEAYALGELARREDRVLTVFHNRRWDSDFLTIKRLLAQGKLGRLRRFESRWERYRPEPKGNWREDDRAGSGVLYDLGSHLIDQALQLFGKPRSVLAHLRTQRQGTSAVDAFDWIGDYGEMWAHLSSNCLTASPTFRFLLSGENATFCSQQLDSQENALKSGKSPQQAGWGEEPQECWGTLTSCDGVLKVPSEKGAYPQFYRNLAATLRGEEPLAVHPEQALEVVRGLELAQKSHDQKGWVSWT